MECTDATVADGNRDGDGDEVAVQLRHERAAADDKLTRLTTAVRGEGSGVEWEGTSSPSACGEAWN